MVVFHGTTMKRARRICDVGFLPRRPSKRVWFAKTRDYADRRARQQARRSHDRPVVLTCEIDLERLRHKLGRKRVFHSHGVIAVDGTVPVTSLRSVPLSPSQPCTPEELARWVNDLLRVKEWKGVSPRNMQIVRLSSWVTHRLLANPNRVIPPTELLGMARRWLPEYFEGYVVVPGTLQAYRTSIPSISVDAQLDEASASNLDDSALVLLADTKPTERIRGLDALRKSDDPDLFEWCLVCIDDPSPKVRLKALHLMARCEVADNDPTLIIPLASSRNKLLRAAAVAALARHSGNEAALWFEYGLKDPSPCVRSEVATFLAQLDPVRNRGLFELAIHDPNPEIARRAHRLAAGHAWARATYRPGRSGLPKPSVGTGTSKRAAIGRRC